VLFKLWHPTFIADWPLARPGSLILRGQERTAQCDLNSGCGFVADPHLMNGFADMKMHGAGFQIKDGADLFGGFANRAPLEYFDLAAGQTK
jgi:hypothetical protein